MKQGDPISLIDFDTKALNDNSGKANRVAMKSTARQAPRLDPDTVLKTLSDGIVIYDDRGVVLHANPAAGVFLGKPHEELLGLQLSWLLPAHCLAQMSEISDTTRHQGKAPNIIFAELPSPASSEPTDVEIRQDQFVHNGQHYGLLNIRDISDFKREYLRLENLASQDDLTGLNNRRQFNALAEKELDRVKRYGTRLSVILFDVDRFKSINDSYGHDAGDQVLKHIATICKQVFRDIDIVARLGGDEFVIMMPETALNQAKRAADRLRRLVSRHCIVTGVGDVCFSISAGVIEAGRNSHDVTELVKKADAALYAAKRQGRNTVKAGYYPAHDLKAAE
jgi:diguanylate cyclase (GGDEF)-like protein/PAS domain S-box-containing protein